MNKVLSIIIPMHNAQAFIKRCLDSILNQGFEDMEIIVVDDGSTDSSCSIVKDYGNTVIRMIRQGKRGVSSARNEGLNLARGKYVIFADADDYLLVGSLQTMYETICSRKVELAVFGYISEKNGNLYEKSFNELRLMGRDTAFIHLFRDPAFRGVLWNKIFVREVIEKNHIRFPEEYTHGEDLIFVTEYLKYCTGVCVTPQLVYMYAENPDSLCRQMYRLNEFNGTYLVLYEAEKVIFSYIKHENQRVLKAFTLKHVETCIDIMNRLAHFKLFHHEKVGEISADVRSHGKQYLFIPDLFPKKKMNIISVLLICISPQLFMRVYYVTKKAAGKL